MIVSAGTESWYLRFAEEPDGVKVHLVNAYIRKLFAEPLQLRSALLAWCTPTHANSTTTKLSALMAAQILHET